MHGRHMEGSAASISSSWALAATRNGPPCCARTGVATRSPAATTPTAEGMCPLIACQLSTLVTMTQSHPSGQWKAVLGTRR